MTMPSRRAAAIILGAAVFTGATAGAGAAVANVDLPLFLAAAPSVSTPPERTVSPRATPAPSRTPSTSPEPAAKRTELPEPEPEPEPKSPQPEPESASPSPETPEPDPEPKKPTEFVTAYFGTPGEREGAVGSSNAVEVPKGWSVVDKGAQWRDFNDPTGNLNLRVRSERLGADNDDAAAKALSERESSDGYTRLSWDTFTYRDFTGETKAGTEVRFTWTGSKGTRYAVERYLEDGLLMIGGYGWEGQFELVEPAVDRAMATYEHGGD
jgi:hypothetical protein